MEQFESKNVIQSTHTHMLNHHDNLRKPNRIGNPRNVHQDTMKGSLLKHSAQGMEKTN